jgi:hypothetical protein
VGGLAFHRAGIHRIRNDADDLKLLTFVPEGLAYGLLVWPGPVRQRLGDDGHSSGFWPIGRLERTPSQDRDLHRLEVAMADDIRADAQRVAVVLFEGAAVRADRRRTGTTAEDRHPCRAGSAYARKPFHSGENLFVHGQSGLGATRPSLEVAARLEIERGDQDSINLVPQVDGIRVGQRAEEEAGSHEEHEAHGHLQHDECAAHSGCTSAGRHGASLCAQRRDGVASAYLKRGGEAEKQSASKTNDERKAEDACVHREVHSLRKHERVK